MIGIQGKLAALVCHTSQVNKGNNTESLLWPAGFDVIAKNDTTAKKSRLHYSGMPQIT